MLIAGAQGNIATEDVCRTTYTVNIATVSNSTPFLTDMDAHSRRCRDECLRNKMATNRRDTPPEFSDEVRLRPARWITASWTSADFHHLRRRRSEIHTPSTEDVDDMAADQVGIRRAARQSPA